MGLALRKIKSRVIKLSRTSLEREREQKKGREGFFLLPLLFILFILSFGFCWCWRFKFWFSASNGIENKKIKETKEKIQRVLQVGINLLRNHSTFQKSKSFIKKEENNHTRPQTQLQHIKNNNRITFYFTHFLY